MNIHALLTTAAFNILRPLIRVMLRNGVACGNFEELVRQAYVDEGFNETKTHGKKATISSVSAATGLSRKEVKRLLDLKETPQQAHDEQRYNRAVRVISGWVNDRRFSNNENIALPLPIEGEERSFARLTKEYSGDIPTMAMLDRLVAANCVERRGDHVYLVKHAYVPSNDSSEIINILGTDVSELINTIDHNLTCDDSKQHFQRKVSCHRLNTEAVPEFQKYLYTHSQALLETLDAWLSNHEATTDNVETRCVSLSIFYHEKENH